MDTHYHNRRPPFTAAPPPHPAPSQIDPRHQQQPAPPSHYHYPPPQPPPPPQQQSHPQTPVSASYPPPPSQQPSVTGPALAPIQQHQAYGPPGVAPDQRSTTLPPFQHPPIPHEAAHPQAQEQHYYGPQHPVSRSGHATPAPVNRTYSHDSTTQRTPTTPGQAGPYPSLPPPPDQSQHHQHQHPQAQPPPPPPPQPSQPPPMDHHPAYAAPNGVPHGLPPPPQHPEQPYMGPPPEGHQYQQGPYYPQGGYGPVSGAQFQVQRKKQMRATQACEQCRQRKQKCDEGVPCSFCKENSLTCAYRDTPPAKTDKNMEKLLTLMEQSNSGLAALTDKLDRMDERLRQLESRPSQQVALQYPDHQPEGPEEVIKKPGDHRTAPHKLLLLWPSVQPLLKKGDVKHHDSYVMEAEDRGILRIYTRGEGVDEHDGTQPGGPASPARSEESTMDPTRQSSSTPPEGSWGTGLLPQTPMSDMRRSEPYTWGGLKPDGTLDLDLSTVDDLFDSYMKHFHIMHPFIDKSRLKSTLEWFKKTNCHEMRKTRAAFVAQMDEDSGRSAKRQRTNGSYNGVSGYEYAPPERSPSNALMFLILALGKISQHKEPLPGIVSDKALVANSFVSHQLTGGHGVSSSSPVPPNAMAVKSSPMSPNATPNAQATPPHDGYGLHNSRSRRTSLDGGGAPSAGPRNIDVVPGLAYYAKAVEIIGDQCDGNDLVQAQAFLLAGLYKGQLARVKESMSWITMAGRAVLSLLDRYKLYNPSYWQSYFDEATVQKKFEQNRKKIKDKRANMIVLASWTVLQLESDILAELPLPSSGIQTVERKLLYPHQVNQDEAYNELDASADRDEDNNILLFYSAQMFLRRKLNQVHQEIYGDALHNRSLSQVRETLIEHQAILEQWRSQLPHALQWEDNDPPAQDILNARLRAKYWGACYVFSRPFLDFALHIMPHTEVGRSVRDVARDANNNTRDEAELHIFEAITGMERGEIFRAARQCVAAAMQSTVAFDGVPNRLITTNIHGTAHAQFGNMLVLAATFNCNHMKSLVPEDRFRRLLERTISFLRRLGPISPTCKIDCSILEKIQRVLFDVPADEKHVYHNEGVVIDNMSAGGSFSAST